MLTNTVRFVSDGFLWIHPSLQGLIVQMRTTQHSEGKLIKNNIEGRLSVFSSAPLLFQFRIAEVIIKVMNVSVSLNMNSESPFVPNRTVRD